MPGIGLSFIIPEKTESFGAWICFYSQVRGMGWGIYLGLVVGGIRSDRSVTY